MIRSQLELITPEQPLITQEPDQAPLSIRLVDAQVPQPATKPEIMLELLIEEVSIDGMCGVY